MSILEASALEVRYGGIRAVKGVNLHVDEGELVCLIGANGAGKSSTLRALAGLIPEAEGSVAIDGREVRLGSPTRSLHAGIAFASNDRKGEGLFLRNSVRGNLVATRLGDVATVGLVRACHHNPDGTANLLLQGVARVAVLGIAREEPYRVISVCKLLSTPGADADADRRHRAKLARLLADLQDLGGPGPDGFLKFLRTVDDPGAFADLAATGWTHTFDAMRAEVAREPKAVREFSDECRFWSATRAD